MRTLFVIDSLGAGGAERSLAQMLPRLVDLDVVASVACFHQRAEGFHDELVAAGVEVHVVQGIGRLGRLRALRSLISSMRPDLLHTTLFEADVLGRLAAVGGPPVLTSLVNTTYGKHRLTDPNVSRHKLEVARRIDAATARRLGSHFHAITRTVKDAAVLDLGIAPSAVTVIPRGRDRWILGQPSDDRRRQARSALGVAQDVPIVLNVGRQEHQKGQCFLLDAAATLRSDRPDLVWLVAGRAGNASAQLAEQHARLDLGDRVRFLGHREDIPELLAAADLFVFPSLYEGLGGALLEAMALQTPVVASDVPAIREVLDDGRSGCLVPPADGPRLAEAVGALLDDPLRATSMAATAHIRFEEHYTLDTVVPRMAGLFHRVANEQAVAP